MIYDVEELPTHGGSLRVYGCYAEKSISATSTVDAVLAAEVRQGLSDLEIYQAFQIKADRVKDNFIGFLIEQKCLGKKVAAYGAAAKGNTLPGIKPDLLSFVCDAAASKQGKFMPGSHIPILSPDVLLDKRPDYLVILPWNIVSEVKIQNARLAEFGTKFVTAVPTLQIV